MEKNTPKLLTKYLIKEFSISLFIFFIIFLMLILLVNYIEEIVYFREKEITNNFLIRVFLITLSKLPTMLIQISPFVFLFSSIFFYVKLNKNNETTSLNLSGLSNKFIVLVPGIFSFFLGIMIILLVTPISSNLFKYYETIKKKYSENDNLAIMSDTGIWLLEKKNNANYIIRTDKVTDDNFSKFQNVTIYEFSKRYQFNNRVDSKEVLVINNKWNFNAAKVTNKENEVLNKNFTYESKINLNKLQNFFKNSSIYSIWNILDERQIIRERGYIAQEITIMFHKYLSLPFLLFAMVFLSKIFTLNINYKFNNFIYIFLGIIVGVTVYFLNDLSIAIGKSGKIPIVLSVWLPIIIILALSFSSLLFKDE